MLTLPAIIPVFYQVEEVVEMKQEVLVKLLPRPRLLGRAGASHRGAAGVLGRGGADNSPVPDPGAKGQAWRAWGGWGSAPLK